jgi:hypothetical protein
MGATYKIQLRTALADQLVRVAEVAGLPPNIYAAQIVEVQLAQTRLARIDSPRAEIRKPPRLPDSK